MRIFLIFSIIFFYGCMNDDVNYGKSDNAADNITDNITDDIINEVNNEKPVAYEILQGDTVINIEKNVVSSNITLKFQNPRDEDVYILIPVVQENMAEYLSFFLQNNVDYVCLAASECMVSFNMIMGEQNNSTSDYSFYMPVTLLNSNEFARFLDINQYDKYKETAMKYLSNRVYIKYLLNAYIKP